MTEEKKYIVIERRKKNILEEQVNKKIKNWYRPQWGVLFNYGSFYQAMVKDDTN